MGPRNFSVISVLTEPLRQVARSSGPIPWERLPIGLAACLRVRGEASWLARTSNVSEALLSHWRKQKRTPSLSRVLELCYALDISPFQLMTNDQVDLRESIPRVAQRDSIVEQEEKKLTEQVF